MHSHCVHQIVMYYFHLAAVCLLLTCLASAYNDGETITLAPCTTVASDHQRIIVMKNISTNIKIFLDDETCIGNEFKLSLVMIKSNFSLISCNENTSLAVNYTTSQGETKQIIDWGCNGKSSYHYGDLVMEVDHVIDDAKEFIISPNDHWKKANVQLVATAYYESEDCRKNFFDCTTYSKGCELYSNEQDKYRRCIYTDLKCDNLPSCGMKCNVDEANDVCHNGDFKYFDWEDFQYILTTFLAALFFILSPTVIVFLLFYRKRMRLQEYQRRMQLEREVRAARERSMVITVSNRLNDHPPTYDDVHETKEPPPCFCAAVALSNEINKDKATEAESQGTSESSTEIKFDCTCKV